MRCSGSDLPERRQETDSPTSKRHDMRSLPRYLAIAVLLAGSISPVVAGQARTCFGERATMTGSSDADLLFGHNGRDVIVGLGGGDVIGGGGGDDLICAGSGHDQIQAHRGDDRIRGGSGRDVIFHSTAKAGVRVRLDLGTARGGGLGRDTLFDIEQAHGSRYADLLVGSAEGNFLFGWNGDDELRGLRGDDILRGGRGRDLLIGGPGTDECVSGEHRRC